MAQDRTKATVFPNGMNRFLAVAVGGAAGVLTTAGDLKADDKIAQVLVLTEASGVPDSVSDLTDEFSVTGDNTIDNSGGTSTAGSFVLVVYDMAPKGY